MPSVTVSLTDRQKNYLDARVESGSYGNVSEVVREALRLLEARDQEQEARLRAATQEASETGLSETTVAHGVLSLSQAVDAAVQLQD